MVKRDFVVNHRFSNFEPEQPTSRPGVNVGSFLVATPNLSQTPFEKSVIFVLQHNREGTFGVVLNRPADSRIKTAWQQISGIKFADQFIVNGGPIGGPVFAIHRDQSLGEMEIPGGIFVSSDREKFSELVDQHSEFRIVFGIAGWKAGQLADEINSGIWFQVDAHPGHVFDDPDRMWEEFIRHYGRQVFSHVLGIHDLPLRPWLN